MKHQERISYNLTMPMRFESRLAVFIRHILHSERELIDISKLPQEKNKLLKKDLVSKMTFDYLHWM